MYYLKLIKARSYMGYGLYATAERPIVTTEDEDAYKAALASGYFAEAAPGENQPQRPDNTGTIEAIDTMNATKLRAYAKKLGLDLSWPSGTSADTIRADIRAAIAENEGGEDDGDAANQFMSGGGDEDDEDGNEDDDGDADGDGDSGED